MKIIQFIVNIVLLVILTGCLPVSTMPIPVTTAPGLATSSQVAPAQTSSQPIPPATLAETCARGDTVCMNTAYLGQPMGKDSERKYPASEQYAIETIWAHPAESCPAGTTEYIVITTYIPTGWQDGRISGQSGLNGKGPEAPVGAMTQQFHAVASIYRTTQDLFAGKPATIDVEEGGTVLGPYMVSINGFYKGPSAARANSPLIMVFAFHTPIRLVEAQFYELGDHPQLTDCNGSWVAEGTRSFGPIPADAMNR